MNGTVLITGAGNTGLLVCAAIDTAAVACYGWRNRGGVHGCWWKSPVGLHLMCFMAAFAVVLDEGAVVIVMRWCGVPVPLWFVWAGTVSFLLLIPPVLVWRLVLILWPPHLRPPR